jgi:hypothetical protein
MQVAGVTTMLAITVAAYGVNAAASTNLPAARGMTLAGVAVGLLIDNGPLAGVARAQAGRTNTPAVFSHDGAERLLYLLAGPGEASAEKRRFYVAEEPAPKMFPRVVPATSQALIASGIREKMALVEVEVNGGAGSAALPLGEAFVATSIRRVDRSSEYPIDPERVARSVVEHCQREESRLFEALNARLAASRHSLSAGSPTTQQRQLSTTFTWLERVGRLRGECVFSLVEQEERFGRGTVPGPAERQQSDQGIRYGRQISIVSKLVFEADKVGRLGKPEETAPVSTIIDRPPPGRDEARS